MKKIVAVLIMFTMVFSGTSCGTKEEAIELTMDNWNEYLEFVDVAYVDGDNMWDRNLPNAVSIYQCLCVKEKYAEGFVAEKSSLEMDINMVEINADYNYDAAKEEISNIKYTKVNKSIASVNSVVMDYDGTKEPELHDELQWMKEGVIELAFAPQGYIDSYKYNFLSGKIKKQNVKALKVDEVTNIKGTITIKVAK